MSLDPATYEEALQKARSKPQKPRTPLRSGSGLKTSLKSTSGQQALSRKATKRSKKKKKLTTGQLKKRAWKEFSIFIRTRGADCNGDNVCITCNERIAWIALQAGHFIRGRLNANLFDERGCHPQCYACNIHRQGNVVYYFKFMRKIYGEAVIDELLAQNNKTHKWLPGELQSIWEKYKGSNAENPLLRD